MASSLLKTVFPPIFSHPPHPIIKPPWLSQDAPSLSKLGRRNVRLPHRLQGVNATNRIFILRVGPCLATLAARQKGSFLWCVTTIWRESTVVRGTLTYLMRNSKPRSGWDGLKSIIRVVAGEQSESVGGYLRSREPLPASIHFG